MVYNMDTQRRGRFILICPPFIYVGTPPKTVHTRLATTYHIFVGKCVNTKKKNRQWEPSCSTLPSSTQQPGKETPGIMMRSEALPAAHFIYNPVQLFSFPNGQKMSKVSPPSAAPEGAWAQVVLPEVALETRVAAQSTILHTGASRIPWAVSFQKDLFGTDMSTSTDVDPNGGM